MIIRCQPAEAFVQKCLKTSMLRCCKHRPFTLATVRSTACHAYNGSDSGYQYPKYDSLASEGNSSSQAGTTPRPQLSNFCRKCGGPIVMRVPPGETELRNVCSKCSYVDYYNPKLVVGCIVEHEGRLLLCRRAIEPCKGLWTVPAGFLEMGESSAAGAARETWEEANARVEILAPYAHWDIPVIGQAYILFRARLAPPFEFGSGTESLETRLFPPHEVPFEKIAFSSVATALRFYVSDLEAGCFHVHHGVIEKAKGSAPNDPGTFVLKDHFAIPTNVPTPAKSAL
ncbi:probable phosphatase NudJ at N-terminal half [Coccomyxa sp. Obi]|nr:probable phosphatase NudJ at N-terminal half [Coccomyxa sp. Obi]